jgi:hypothetical protein
MPSMRAPDVDAWLERFRRLWDQRLGALATEIARGNDLGADREVPP